MLEINIHCVYCPPGDPLLSARPKPGQSGEEWQAAWKRAAPLYESIQCPGCGSQLQLEDDGVEPSVGGSVQRKNVSKPRIDSLDMASGSAAGGELLTVTGSALDLGTLSITFDGRECSILEAERTASTAKILTPAGVYRLLVDEQLSSLTTSQSYGSFVLGEALLVDNVEVGKLRDSDGTTMWSGLAASQPNLASKVVLGATSGATATISAVSLPLFAPGEELVGTMGGARAVLRTRYNYVVDSPVAPFLSNEVVRGSSSGARAFLGLTPYHGRVDVTVSNEFGQREVGGTLINGFTYL